MEIFEFAIQMEKDGEIYYRELARASRPAGLQKIFTLLADEEVQHRKLLEDLHQRTPPKEGQPSRILENVKNIFITMAKQPPGADMKDQINAFKKALQIEEMSRNFYQQKADEARDGQAKAILNLLIREETGHIRIMENIVEFVSRPEPGRWLENAEWHHLDEY